MTGRDIFYDAISGRVEAIRFTDAPYATVDGFLTGRTGQKVVFEIKHRQFPSSKYPTKMLEVEKATSLLINKNSNRQDKAIYVCIFDDAIYLYEVTPDTIAKERRERRNCPVHSADFDGVMKQKEVIMLTDEEAIWIHRRPSRTS